MEKTAVLIHGCHLQTEGWEQVAAGDVAHDRLGRISRGVLEAYRTSAQLIFFGTGASEKDGMKESEYTFHTAEQQWRKLAVLCGADHETMAQENPFLQWLYHVSVMDAVSKNTDEELRRCLDLCVEQDITRLILVSSPFHAPRCLQRAQVVLDGLSDDKRYARIRRNMYTVASDTNPTDLDTNDVVIVEPAHRGDNPKVPFYVQIRRLFQFLRQPDLAFELCDELRQLIDRFEARLKS